MFYTVYNFFPVDKAEYAVYLDLEIYLLLVLNGSDPHSFKLVLEDGEHTLYGIAVWRVGWSEDVLQPKLFNTIHNIVALMHPQVIHDDTDIIKEIFPPKLIKE